MDKFSSRIKALYESGKSMGEVAQILNCSVHKIVYWMEKNGIPRRNHSDASYIKQNPYGDPFLIKEILSPSERVLYGIGLGIYWGEGEKASLHAIRVANTDPFLIKIFRKFLLDICQLKKEKISYSLVCFNNSNETEVKTFWSNNLKISPEKFGKIVHIPTQGKGTYRKKSSLGVCTITATNIKLKTWLLGEIKKFKFEEE